VAAIADLAAGNLRIVPPERLDKLARTDAPQGVVALAAPLRSADLDELCAVDDAFLVAVDGVTDPRNLGAIVRSAETAGATGVIVGRHRAAHVTPAVTKAAAGAIEHMPIALVGGIPNALERAQRAGCWTVGLDERGDTSLYDLPVADQRIVLVLGAEGRGLGRLTRARCDVLAHIPMYGALPSLNVAAAATLACHEVARRRHQ
jgi:23S rRNA (guanosine2251-2'-O)-methyltransferase